MSTATPQVASVAAPKQELKVISHSQLVYWWPVWAVGLLMGVITWMHGTMLAVVPDKTMAGQEVGFNLGKDQEVRVKLDVGAEDIKDRSVLFAPKGKTMKTPHQHVANSAGPGVVFLTVLLLVIFITNVALRGLWSVLVIVVIILGATLLSVFRVWDDIFALVGLLDIRISMGGYFFVSVALFILWLVALLFFDPKTYMIFSPGQIRYCLEIGDGEHVHDATNLSVRKQRDDIFRHWILGMGSGDLIVTTGGQRPEEFPLPNVLFVSSKLKQIEELLRSRPVVAGGR